MGQLSAAAQTEAMDFALRVADAAAGILDPHQNGAYAHWKTDGTPVSVYDREIEEMVVAAVAEERKGEEVLGEEDDGSHQPKGSVVWVVDPIDGTELFVKGLPGYVFSIALVIDGQPEVAVVRDPRTGTTWTATVGHGAWRNFSRMSVSSTTEFTGSKVRLPRGPANYPYIWPEVLSVVQASGVQRVQMGSVVRAAMAVAEGELDGLIYGRTSPWDMATAALIVPEAGGRFTDLIGKIQRVDGPVNGGVLSNLWLHEDLLGLVDAQKR